MVASSTLRLGLGSRRVKTHFDRGESDYNLNHPPAPDQQVATHECNLDHKRDVISDIMCELDRAQKQYPPGAHSSIYISRHDLGIIITPIRVLKIIGQLDCCANLSTPEREELRNRICFGANPCSKLLVVLLLIEKQEDLLCLVRDERVSDQCLPLSVGNKHSKQPECRIQGHNHPTISSWLYMKRCEASKWSYAVKAPYFTRKPGGVHNHLVLDINDVWPIPESQSVHPSDASVPQTQHRMETVSGGFGEVQRLVLDDSHYDFWTRDGTRLPARFALKTLHPSTTLEMFNQELASLLTCQDEDDKALIKLLATFEVRRNNGSGGETTAYYLLFPWAEGGDLWSFFRAHSSEAQRLERCAWMAEQIYQLCRGLVHVHNERRNQLRRIFSTAGDPDSRHELFGRHGDIKGENILWFKDKGGDIIKDILVIIDFGLGRLHSKYSRSGIDPSQLGKSATYRAPEFDLHRGTISRLCDIFSFGCTCLEIVTWYLLGPAAAGDEFTSYRMEKDKNGHETDTFFKIEGSEEGAADAERAVIKPKVTEWIDRLRKCTSRLKSVFVLQFLELIEQRMLEPDSSKRIKSDELESELFLLADTCRRNSSFYKDYCDKLSEKKCWTQGNI